MSGETSMASVTDLGDYLASTRSELEFAWLIGHLNDLRSALFQPPAELLPAIFAQIDRVDRLPWARPGPTRWVTYAGVAASAGALVLASRRRWN